MLVKKYHESNCKDKEIRESINKAIDSSSELRSKKDLISNFIEKMNSVDDVMDEWRSYVNKERDAELDKIISEQRLKPEETRKFMKKSFTDGEVKTFGTDIDALMPPISRFGGNSRAKKKQTVIELFKAFFEKFFGISSTEF